MEILWISYFLINMVNEYDDGRRIDLIWTLWTFLIDKTQTLGRDSLPCVNGKCYFTLHNDPALVTEIFTKQICYKLFFYQDVEEYYSKTSEKNIYYLLSHHLLIKVLFKHIIPFILKGHLTTRSRLKWNTALFYSS